MKQKILVVGSINLDYISYVKNFPNIGETVNSSRALRQIGGKGFNQAIAVKSSLSSQDVVNFFGKVNKTDEGKTAITNLKNIGIKTENIKFSSKPTGIASIIVSEQTGDKVIAITKGANGDFSKKDYDLLRSAIYNSDAVLLQMETNDWLNQNTLKIAKELGKTTFVDATPIGEFKKIWIQYTDWLFINKEELENLANGQIFNLNDLEEMLQRLKKEWKLSNCVVSLQESGSYLFTNKTKKHIGTSKVRVVDSTGAGDALVGTFVGSLMSNQKNDYVSDLKLAMKSSSFSLRKYGSSESIPRKNEIKRERK